MKLIEQSPPGIRIYLKYQWNLMQTGFLLLTWIIMGLHLELINATSPRLAEHTKIGYGDIVSALALRNFGYLIANMLGLIIPNTVDKYPEGLLILSFIISAIMVCATPFVTSLVLMCILFFFQGASQGLTDLAGLNILLSIWGEHAATPISIVQFGYGIGAIFVNLFARPFLIEKPSSISITDHTRIVKINENSNLAILYFITTSLCVLIAAGHVIFYIRDCKNQRQRLKIDHCTLRTNAENTNHFEDQHVVLSYSPGTFGWGNYRYGLFLSIIFLSYKFFIAADEHIFSKFLFTYLRSEQSHITNKTANLGTILYWLSFSIGRLIVAIVSLMFSVYNCMNIIWFGGLCSALGWLLLIWTTDLTLTTLNLLSAITGLIFAPLFPLSLGLINQRLNITPVFLALLLCASSLGSIIFENLAGIVIDHDWKYFPVLLIICVLLSITVYLISNAVYFNQRRKECSLITNHITTTTI